MNVNGISTIHYIDCGPDRLSLYIGETHISPKAIPSDCKIIVYKKFLGQSKKKEKELKDKTAHTLMIEMRFGPNKDDHDFESV